MCYDMHTIKQGPPLRGPRLRAQKGVKMKTVINHYETRGHVFTIVKDQGKFLAIDHKYLDEEGRTAISLNGFQMHAADSLKGCMENADRACWLENLMSEGLSRAEAFCTVNGMECTDQVRELFGEIERACC